MTHSVPTAFIMMNAVGTEWVTHMMNATGTEWVTHMMNAVGTEWVTHMMNAVGTEWVTRMMNAVGTEWVTPGLPKMVTMVNVLKFKHFSFSVLKESGDPDQTASSSDLGLHCLSKPFSQANSVGFTKFTNIYCKSAKAQQIKWIAVFQIEPHQN